MDYIAKKKDLTIHLLVGNERNYRLYLKKEYRYHEDLKRHYVDKKKINGDVDRGIIFIYEQEFYDPPEWIKHLNQLSEKNEIKVSPKKTTKALLFLTVKTPRKQTFAISFGNGVTLLDKDLIVPDFGLTVGKSVLSDEELISIDTMSVDQKIFNTRKQSAAFLFPDKLLEYGTQNIVKSVYGRFKDSSLGGNDHLKFRGDIDLVSELVDWLKLFSEKHDSSENNLGLVDGLHRVDRNLKKDLDNLLADKVLKIIHTNNLTRNQLLNIKIAPYVLFDVDKFQGYFIKGMGYSENTEISSDSFIDELYFFKRMQKRLKGSILNNELILKKLKTTNIHRKEDNDSVSMDSIPVCSVYQAINFTVSYQDQKYILAAGKWYEVDKQYYKSLKDSINSIKSIDVPDTIDFINFDLTKHFTISKKNKVQESEGKYNEDVAEFNKVLMLDRKNYTPSNKRGLDKTTAIEVCDVLNFNKDVIQFIHIKRHANAAGTSHLLSQATVSAKLFDHDYLAIEDHINKHIKQFNTANSSYQIPDFEYKGQKKEIILAIIGKKGQNIKKPNSSLLTLLEMISLNERVKSLNVLGFNCYLKFIENK